MWATLAAASLSLPTPPLPPPPSPPLSPSPASASPEDSTSDTQIVLIAVIAALLLLAVLFVVLICRQFKVYAQLIDRLRSAGKTREEAKKRLDGYREQAARVSAIVDERAAERWRSAIGQITAVRQIETPPASFRQDNLLAAVLSATSKRYSAPCSERAPLTSALSERKTMMMSQRALSERASVDQEAKRTPKPQAARPSMPAVPEVVNSVERLLNVDLDGDGKIGGDVGPRTSEDETFSA